VATLVSQRATDPQRGLRFDLTVASHVAVRNAGPSSSPIRRIRSVRLGNGSLAGRGTTRVFVSAGSGTERGFSISGLGSRWVAWLSGDTCAVRWKMRSDNIRPPLICKHESSAKDIASFGSGFVMINLRRVTQHRTFTYSNRLDLPSPLEFLGWADALRARQTATVAPKMPTAVRPDQVINTPLPQDIGISPRSASSASHLLDGRRSRVSALRNGESIPVKLLDLAFHRSRVQPLRIAAHALLERVSR